MVLETHTECSMVLGKSFSYLWKDSFRNSSNVLYVTSLSCWWYGAEGAKTALLGRMCGPAGAPQREYGHSMVVLISSWVSHLSLYSALWLIVFKYRVFRVAHKPNTGLHCPQEPRDIVITFTFLFLITFILEPFIKIHENSNATSYIIILLHYWIDIKWNRRVRQQTTACIQHLDPAKTKRQKEIYGI